MNNFLQRILSSIAIALVIIGSVFLPLLFFYSIVTLLLYGCAYEWQGISTKRSALTTCFCLWLCVAFVISLYYSWGFLSSTWCFLVVSCMGHAGTLCEKATYEASIGLLVYILHGGATLLPMAYALTVIRSYGIEYWIMLFVWVWATDVGGYIFGRLLANISYYLL